MNISAINSYLTPALERVAPRATAVPAHAAPAAATANRVENTGIPVDAPKGTDDKLWSVLTSQERSFLGRARAVSSPVYGPSGSMSASFARGQGLNIRV